MRCMLFLLAALTHLAGIALFSQAKSALHEVEGFGDYSIFTGFGYGSRGAVIV